MIAGIGPEGPLAIYLTLGMVATVNPCGFAMLPAYLAYFLGVDDRDAVPRATVATALGVAAAVAAGFLTVFALAGLAVELTSLPVYENVPWISIVIGAAPSRSIRATGGGRRRWRGRRSRRWRSATPTGL